MSSSGSMPNNIRFAILDIIDGEYISYLSYPLVFPTFEEAELMLPHLIQERTIETFEIVQIDVSNIHYSYFDFD